MKVQVNPEAYSKILLHACKYPHKAINGIVLADDNNQNDIIRIVDTIPLFHQCLGLAPMLEVALSQVDAYCQRKKFIIAGYYQGNEHINSNSPDNIAYKIAEKINENFSRSLLIMINNKNLEMDCKTNALEVYVNNEGKWKKKDWELVGGDVALGIASHLMKCKTYQSLVDFDNHLDDVTNDWLNRPINELVSCTPIGNS